MKLFFGLFCSIALLSLFGCGGDSNSGYVSVTISPTSSVVGTSLTKQFTAKVSNASNKNVTWQVNGVTGGNSTYGTISGSGLYTAPATIPGSPTVTITAIATADITKTAEASVTIAQPVSVSPATASVQVSSTQSFSASVNFSTNTEVSWQVNGVAGGNSTVGTISSSGSYTAPASVPAPNTVTITAVPKADNSRTASATVTVTPAAIVISPTSAVVTAGAQQVYTATALSNTIHPIWSVSCATPGACGTISSEGTYTAPSTPPPHALVTITASTADGSAATASTTATIQFGNATLAGTYIFTTMDQIGHKGPSQAGAVVFDGAGHISAGIIDSTDAPGTPLAVTGGTYQVGTDGRGTATIQTSSSPLNLQLVVTNHAQGLVVRTDSAANQSAGTIELQQTASIAPVLNASYALAVSGSTTGASAGLLAEAGSVLVDGTGAIGAGAIDISKDLALQSTTVTGGAVTQPLSGYRGTLAFTTSAGTQTFAYYPVDGKRAKVVGIDGTSTAIGDLYLQPQGPFSPSSLKGRYVFSVTGAKSSVPYGIVGRFSLDGAGGIGNLLFDGIKQTVFDFNTGDYSVTDAQTGRTTATWTGNGGSRLQYVLYPRSDGGIVLLQSDGVYQGTGEALPQADTWPSALPSPQDGFALLLGGSETSTPSNAERLTAHVGFSTTTILRGTADGTITGQGADVALTLQGQDMSTQRYTFGLSSSKLTDRSVVVYRINDNRAFVIQTDKTSTMTGELQRQY